MNVVKATTWHAHCEEHEKMIVSGVYGRARTLNFRSLTSKTVEILAKYNDTIPGPGSLFSAQLHHDPIPPEKSVFAPRSDHYWLEIVATSLDEASAKRAEDWALALKQELLNHDPENILESAYLGFLSDGELDLNKVYGDQYETLLSLKQRLDPANVFRNTVPKL
ncbi:hypothetical protein NW757_014239 [Fusarium falciforme]|nr:hypothetical protein NW757_014239 [Fusarium falciforme]